MEIFALLGRILMSAIFLRFGYAKLVAPATTMASFAHYHLPLPGAAYAVAVAVELIGGAMVLVGWRTRPAASMLGIWCIATALVAHLHPAQAINFMKNLCMAGGFVQLALYGPGRYSVDRR
jgi:putative oxidoreductase